MNREADISALKGLVSALIDSADAYEDAARHVSSDPALQDLFTRRAADRRAMAAELRDQAAASGATVAEDGTGPAAVDRFLMDVKGMLGDKIAAAIEEVARVEEYVAGSFRRALQNEDLSATARALIQRLNEAVIAQYDEIRAMRQAAQ